MIHILPTQPSPTIHVLMPRTFRKGDSTGVRDASGPTITTTLDALKATPTDELAAPLARATRAELITAHRWCEANPEGNRTRKEAIARQLRKIS